MKIGSQFIVVAALAAAGVAVWQYGGALWGGAEPDGARAARAPTENEVAVEVAAAEIGEVIATVQAVGTARANESVVITPEVQGVIKVIAFDEEQTVAQGAVLVELDPGRLAAEIDEMRAESELARRLYERADKLVESGNVPKSRIDELRAEVQASEARERADESALQDYVIRAPFSGRLGLRRVSLGALVSPGTEITTLDDTSRMKVDFEVPESALGSLRPGLAVTARSIAYPGRVFEGLVETIDSRVDPETRSVTVRTRVPNTDDVLKPGMFLSVTLVISRRDDAVLVPEEAIVSGASERFVYAVIDGMAVRTVVETGDSVAGRIEILSGLAPGIEVIVGGVQKVSDGTRVVVADRGGGG